MHDLRDELRVMSGIGPESIQGFFILEDATTKSFGTHAWNRNKSFGTIFSILQNTYPGLSSLQSQCRVSRHAHVTDLWKEGIILHETSTDFGKESRSIRPQGSWVTHPTSLELMT